MPLTEPTQGGVALPAEQAAEALAPAAPTLQPGAPAVPRHRSEVLYFAVRNFLLDLWYTGFAALGRVGDYLLLGAAIVVPAFVILRVLSCRR